MYQIVKAFGWLQVLLGIAVFAFGAAMAARDGPIVALPVLATAVGLIVAGAISWCLGAMVDHLGAIRRSNEAQAKALADWLKQPTP